MRLLIEKSKEIDDFTVFLALFELYKSYLLLISDQKEMGIGSVTLGSPATIEGLKATSATYTLFGVYEKLLSTIIAEKASFLLKAPVILMLFLKSKKKEEDIAKPIVNFLDEILSEVSKKKD
jgi:hypothetical protein